LSSLPLSGVLVFPVNLEFSRLLSSFFVRSALLLCSSPFFDVLACGIGRIGRLFSNCFLLHRYSSTTLFVSPRISWLRTCTCSKLFFSPFSVFHTAQPRAAWVPPPEALLSLALGGIKRLSTEDKATVRVTKHLLSVPFFTKLVPFLTDFIESLIPLRFSPALGHRMPLRQQELRRPPLSLALPFLLRITAFKVESFSSPCF